MVIEQKILQTERLLLRPFEADDAPDVQQLAGDRDVSETTLHIPHPYEDGMAEAWIATHSEALASGENVVYAITLRSDCSLIGGINAAVAEEHRRATLGYWIGKPFWRMGYGTEVARSIIGFCFETLDLHRVHSHYLSMNPASGRVMEKVGMTREGCLRAHMNRDGELNDVIEYGILRSEYASS